jgi:hypothetical protein
MAAAVALAFLWMGADYENRLYDALVAHAIRPGMGEEARILALMRTSHTTVQAREPLFHDITIGGPHAALFRSGDTELLQADGSCGTCAHVFVEACHRANIAARVCQLSEGGTSTSHVIAEARLEDRWVVVDPLFNQVFRDRQGKLVGCEEIEADWEYYRRQAPDYLRLGYHFGSVRYTNWSKVPVLMPLAKKCLDLVVGQRRADRISLRSYCLNIYSAYLYLLLVLTFGVNAFVVLRAWRHSRRPTPATRARDSQGAVAPGDAESNGQKSERVTTDGGLILSPHPSDIAQAGEKVGT